MIHRNLLRRATAALVALALIGLASTSAHAADTHAYVLTSDYSSGGMSLGNLDTRVITRDVASAYSDARMRWFGGLLYVVNRFGQDNIQVIDPANNFTTVRQFSVGNGSNPQDIAFLSSTKAYVTRLASSRLLIVNPATGDSIGAIALGAFADADHIPEMDHMIRVGTTLFVALERLSNFQPTDSSVVVAIDTRADTVIDAVPALPGIQAIALPGTNPTTGFDIDPATGRLILGCTGSYGVGDGGIAWIDTQTLTSGGFAVTEPVLGGDVLGVVWGSATRSFAIVSDAGYNTSLVAWNPTTGAKLATVFAPGGFSIADAVLNDRGELYVCDNDAFGLPGLYVFSAATGAALAGPLDTGLPPVAVAFDHSGNTSPTGVPVASALTRVVELSAPWPQPATRLVRARLTLARGSLVSAEILDLQGRTVRALTAGEFAAGTRELAWDMRDTAGRKALPGVYIMRARLGQSSFSQRVIVTR